MNRICLYYRPEPEWDRWVPYDRVVRPLIRRLVRGKARPGGVEKVFINLCLGLDRLGIPYKINLPFQQLHPTDKVGILGRGLHCLDGYDCPNPIVAGIGLMTHPSEWPTLCEDYPVIKYLQHSAWAADVYRPYYGDRIDTWPVGIDTQAWAPAATKDKPYDFLIYDKIRWNRDTLGEQLLQPICSELQKRGLSFIQLRYGHYEESNFKKALGLCRGMIFLCEHESQGLAYQECLASGVPILAWDQGWCLDPNRFAWGQPEIPASSVPFFDERCGKKFRDVSEFSGKLDQFLSELGSFQPREYILENLSLEKCAQDFVNRLNGQ